MGTLSLNDISPGAEILSSDVNDNNTLIEAVINGGIDNGNFAANTPVVVASTIAGLGAVRAGKMGLLRIGASPFESLPVIYDATLAKWVSEPRLMIAQQNTETYTATGYTNLSGAEFPTGVIPNFKALYDAGLRPQVFLSVFIKNSGAGNTTFFRASLNSFNANEGSTLGLNVTSPELSHVGNTQTYKILTWTTMAFDAPVRQHGQFFASGKVTAGTGTVDNGTIWMRWVNS